MGKSCTRACGFCSIDFDKQPKALESDEPQRVVDSVKALGLRHVVLTMVARDDLPDGGSSHLKKIVEKLRQSLLDVTIEVLTSDFNGNLDAWQTVLESRPDVFNYNVETVRRLSGRVRHKATYERTLQLLKFMRQGASFMKVKSGLMVGLGETRQEVFETLQDLKDVGCDIVTIGQYLQPTLQKLLVKAFISPEEFKIYEQHGMKVGLAHVYAGPFVRSSYNADLFV
jgi:lipoic acid synthetase